MRVISRDCWWFRDNLNNVLCQLVLDNAVILSEELWCLTKSSKQTQQSTIAELIVVWEWRVAFFPWQADFIVMTIEGNLLNELLVN